jgi:hypothetical protein
LEVGGLAVVASILDERELVIGPHLGGCGDSERLKGRPGDDFRLEARLSKSLGNRLGGKFQPWRAQSAPAEFVRREVLRKTGKPLDRRGVRLSIGLGTRNGRRRKGGGNRGS